MNIKKLVLAELDKVYSVCSMDMSGKTYLLAASEAEGKCLMFSPPDWKVSDVWEKPGGTMTLIPIPGKQGEMLAIQKFFPVFKSENACIVHAKADRDVSSPWIIKKVVDIPFVHRIEVVEIGKKICVVASSLCGSKSFQDDWSVPGAVYWSEFEGGCSVECQLKPVLNGLTKNHGMAVINPDGCKAILIAASEGVFQIDIPSESMKPWEHVRLIDSEVSDMAAVDIDCDGNMEIVTIEPFHGDKLVIYKKICEKWIPVFTKEIEFGHALWAGRILNKPGIIVGNRGGRKDLTLLHPVSSDPLVLESITIDEGTGPTQVCVVNGDNSAMILAANHGAGQVVLYELTMDD